MKYILTITFVLCLVYIMGAPIQAATVLEQGLDSTAKGGGLIPSDGKVSSASAVTESINVKIGRVVAALLSFMGLVFMIMIIYGGMLWMTAGGNPDAVKKARAYIINAAIGLALVAMAYGITNYLISLIGEQTME